MAGFRWGLVKLRSTYKDLREDEVIEYPRQEETPTPTQSVFLKRYRKRSRKRVS